MVAADGPAFVLAFLGRDGLFAGCQGHRRGPDQLRRAELSSAAALNPVCGRIQGLEQHLLCEPGTGSRHGGGDTVRFSFHRNVFGRVGRAARGNPFRLLSLFHRSLARADVRRTRRLPDGRLNVFFQPLVSAVILCLGSFVRRRLAYALFFGISRCLLRALHYEFAIQAEGSGALRGWGAHGLRAVLGLGSNAVRLLPRTLPRSEPGCFNVGPIQSSDAFLSGDTEDVPGNRIAERCRCRRHIGDEVLRRRRRHDRRTKPSSRHRRGSAPGPASCADPGLMVRKLCRTRSNHDRHINAPVPSSGVASHDRCFGARNCDDKRRSLPRRQRLAH